MCRRCWNLRSRESGIVAESLGEPMPDREMEPEVPTRGDAALTVLVHGSFAVGRLAASYARGFEGAGCRVLRDDVRERDGHLAPWLRTRVGRRLTLRSLWLRRWGSRDWNSRFLSRVQKVRPDVVAVVKGEYLMPETMRRVRETGSVLVLVHPDDPFPESVNHRPELLPDARGATCNFIWSRRLVRRLNATEGRNVKYLPFAWDPEVFPYVADGVGPGSRPRNGPEVVFVGGWDRRRERWLEPVAKRFELEIWGPDYWATRTRRGSPVRECWQGRALRGREAAEAVARAQIALNILREQNLPDGTNMRTFEAPGAGGFLLSTRTAGATEIYPEGEAGAYFGSVEEMLEKIDHYLTHPADRSAIARRAHEITASGHRYGHRARRILEELAVAI